MWKMIEILIFVNTPQGLFIDFVVLNQNQLSAFSCGYRFFRKDFFKNFWARRGGLELFIREYFFIDFCKIQLFIDFEVNSFSYNVNGAAKVNQTLLIHIYYTLFIIRYTKFTNNF